MSTPTIILLVAGGSTLLLCGGCFLSMVIYFLGGGRGSSAAKPNVPNFPPAVLPALASPALAQEKVVVSLPGPLDEVCVGGGGRFLIMHLPQQQQLAIFDVNEAKVVKFVPLPQDQVFFAAGADKLFVVLQAQNLIQRWDLNRLERETDFPAPYKGTVKSVLMGSASTGPLVMGVTGQGPGSGLIFLDPQTGRLFDYEWQGDRLDFNHYPPTMRMSADGQVLTNWSPNLSPSGLSVLVINGSTITRRYEHQSVGYVLPGPENHVLFTPGLLYSTELKPMGKNDSTHGKSSWRVPAVQGRYYLVAREAPNTGDSNLRLEVNRLGEERPLGTVQAPEGLNGLVDWQTGQQKPFYDHLFLVPSARLLMVIPVSNDKIILHRLGQEMPN